MGEEVDIPVCPCCDRHKSNIFPRRMGTRYQNDGMNYITSCLDCYTEIEDHWTDMWTDYYRAVL